MKSWISFLFKRCHLFINVHCMYGRATMWNTLVGITTKNTTENKDAPQAWDPFGHLHRCNESKNICTWDKSEVLQANCWWNTFGNLGNMLKNILFTRTKWKISLSPTQTEKLKIGWPLKCMLSLHNEFPLCSHNVPYEFPICSPSS